MWIALALAVAAAALQKHNQDQLAKKQDAAVTQGILQRRSKEAQESQDIQNTARQLKDSNAQPATDKATTQYLSDLQKGSPISTVGSAAPTTGVLSEAYRQAAGAANQDNARTAATTAGLMGITDAAGVQRNAEGNTISDLGARLAGLSSQANDQTNLAKMRAAAAKANPWTTLLASALGSAASAYGSQAGTTGGSTATPQSSTNLGYSGEFSPAGGTYTGAGSLSTDYTSNARNLYGI